MPEDSFRFDPRYWHNIQEPEEMDVSRYFEYDEDAISLLKKWLRIEKPPGTIVEVGCGSGYFTEKLIEMSPASLVVAVEPDDVLREYAEKKLSTKVRFLKGTAEDVPLPDDFADLTVCHIVLHNLPNVKGAVSGMTRVTKPDGIVAAIEPGGGGIDYYPDPKLDELEKKAGEAYARGVWDLRSKLIDYSKDLKEKRARYAEVFHSCGLIGVEAHGILSVFLLSDPRRRRDELLEWLRKRLLIHENDRSRMTEILNRGGLSIPVVNRYYRARKSYLTDLIEHPEQISRTHELHTTSRTITIGFKPRERLGSKGEVM